MWNTNVIVQRLYFLLQHVCIYIRSFCGFFSEWQMRITFYRAKRSVARLCRGKLSVCPSLCDVGELWWQASRNSSKIISRLISIVFFLTLQTPTLRIYSKSNTSNFSRNISGVEKIVDFRYLSRRISETVLDTIGSKLLLTTNRNMYARFRLVPNSMTLNDLRARFKVIDSLNATKMVKYSLLKIDDLRWPWGAIIHSVTLCACFSEPITKIWMKIDAYYQQRKCSVETLVCEDIRVMPIFIGVRWIGGSNESGVVENIVIFTARGVAERGILSRQVVRLTVCPFVCL